MDRAKFRGLPFYSSRSHRRDVCFISRSIFGGIVFGAVGVWWSCLCLCVADGFHFNRSGSALDGNEELETTSLCWKSLDLDRVPPYLYKTCEGRSSFVLSPVLDLHFAYDCDSVR